MSEGENIKEQTRKLLIRRATAYDVVNLTKMLIQAREEQAKHVYYPALAEGERGRKMVIYHVLGMINSGIVYVADLDGRLLGAIGMDLDKLAEWSDEFGLINEWFYVLPQFRDSDIARNLLKAVEDWADADIQPWNGEPKPRMAMIIGMLSGQQTGLKNKFMQRLGYQNCGGNFVRSPMRIEADGKIHRSDRKEIRSATGN